eukprot:m.818659 g.818659  ORF g.818659 m.818659 type:complete len:55 (+) comp23394_c0_seq189:4946-5110(+)
MTCIPRCTAKLIAFARDPWLALDAMVFRQCSAREIDKPTQAYINTRCSESKEHT